MAPAQAAAEAPGGLFAKQITSCFQAVVDVKKYRGDLLKSNDPGLSRLPPGAN
jgi:hypothetical protein